MLLLHLQFRLVRLREGLLEGLARLIEQRLDLICDSLRLLEVAGMFFVRLEPRLVLLDQSLGEGGGNLGRRRLHVLGQVDARRLDLGRGARFEVPVDESSRGRRLERLPGEGHEGEGEDPSSDHGRWLARRRRLGG